MKKSSLILLASALALASATAATAQTAPTPPTFGAAVPGQCVLDEQTAVISSNMGKAAIDRLQQLKAAVDAELQPEVTAVQTEGRSLAAEQSAATTPAAQKAFGEKASAWSNRRDALQQKMQQREQELQATQEQVLNAVLLKTIPSINAVVTQKQCATVISADALLHYATPGATNDAAPVAFLYANPSMNITDDVVAKVNASGEVLPPFNRATLGGQQGAPVAGAAPAARPAAKPAAKPAASK